jgi:hypothetical protein
MKKKEEQIHKLLMQHRGNDIFSLAIEAYQKKPDRDYFGELISFLKSQGKDNPKSMAFMIGETLLYLINRYSDQILSQA